MARANTGMNPTRSRRRRSTDELYCQAQPHRLAARRGKHRAPKAVGHCLFVTGYHLITRQETFQDLRANYFDECDREGVKRRAVRRLEKLGFQVQLKPMTALTVSLVHSQGR